MQNLSREIVKIYVWEAAFEKHSIYAHNETLALKISNLCLESL